MAHPDSFIPAWKKSLSRLDGMAEKQGMGKGHGLPTFCHRIKMALMLKLMVRWLVSWETAPLSSMRFSMTLTLM